MVDLKRLDAMANEHIKGKDPGTLPDLLNVTITGESPMERLENFLEQVENPYCFRVGKTPVKITFSGSESLESILKYHFMSLKCNDFPDKK